MKSPALTGVVSALSPVSACTTAPLKMPGCTATRLTLEETCNPEGAVTVITYRAERSLRGHVEVDLGIARVEGPHVDAVEGHGGAAQIGAEERCQRAWCDTRGKRSGIHHGPNHRHRAAGVQRQG